MTKYRDVRLIGKGGFGEVWECECEADGKRYARKRLHKDTTQEATARFKREVKILQERLDHPNIVPVVGKRIRKPPYWFVMPLYRCSLDEELAALAGDWERAQAVFGKVLAAISHAHNQKVIHRDLKPLNILLGFEDEVAVSDFGFGRALHSESTRYSVSGYGMGTLGHIAPEQAFSAKHVDGRADIYSLGVMLYQLCTGPMDRFQPELSRVPANVRSIVGKCLEHDPDDRFQSVRELAGAWKAATDGAAPLAPAKEVESLVKKMVAGEVLKADVNRLLMILSTNMDDGELLHDAVIQVPEEVVAAMVSKDRNAALAVIRSFAEWTARSPFDFNFTDVIARRCKTLFDMLDDYEVRAELLYCVLAVGLKHSRWFVLQTFDEMLRSSSGPAESAVWAGRIRMMGVALRNAIRGRVSRSQLDPCLEQVIFR